MKTYNMGPLEQEIMQFLWTKKNASVSQVHKHIKINKNSIAYTTVMTIMGRLSQKGLLERRLVGKAYIYFPKISKEQTLKSIVKKTISSLVNQYGYEAMTAFTSEIKRHK